MSSLAHYSVVVEYISTGKLAKGIIKRAASEEEARRSAEEEIRQLPKSDDLRVATVRYVTAATMAGEGTMTANGEVVRRYDTDILTWSESQSKLLRRRAAGEWVNEAELDWANLAEEIESLGHSERSKLRNHIGTVLEHLIKLQASPATDPRNRWKASVVKARRGIRRSLKDIPSLRHEVAAMITDETLNEREDVAATLTIYGEQARVDIGSLTVTEDQVLGDWLPD